MTTLDQQSPYSGTTAPRVTEAAAIQWLTVECQVTTEPCLTAEEVQHLVHSSRRADADGRPPSDSAWVPTYALNWAAWKGWLLKAGKAVLMVDVSGDGTQVNKSQVHDHCVAMAREFARGVQQTVASAPSLGEWAITSPETNATESAVGDLDRPGTIPGVTYP